MTDSIRRREVLALGAAAAATVAAPRVLRAAPPPRGIRKAVKLGMPEVTLGLLPGAGGCVRMPRLIGLQSSFDTPLWRGYNSSEPPNPYVNVRVWVTQRL